MLFNVVPGTTAVVLTSQVFVFVYSLSIVSFLVTAANEVFILCPVHLRIVLTVEFVISLSAITMYCVIGKS